MKAEIEILQPGLFSTIQDNGRFGFMEFGVPVSGVMDKYAAKIVNLLLGNPVDAAVMEITLQGPQLKFHTAINICLSGADLSAAVNGNPVKRNELLQVENGDVLKFGKRKSGFRAYLGVSGGFDTEKVMNSRSWYRGITRNFKLEKNYFLKIHEFPLKTRSTNASIKVDENYLFDKSIDAFPGPEFDKLSEEQQEEIFKVYFSLEVSSNRMAISFAEKFSNEIEPILTGPVLPGTVQLTPAGNVIALMQDCQTTGGYPRILQLSEFGKQVLSQKMPGEKIRFKKVDY
ncbi:allophanate hydrolase [Christiangramia fulva]|uniref:Allophanate hydrolase n=1 Tax=Christiangramia fulva TaxID=2126553 RepID=A0A2R3ZBF0_9FLAO|nr:biotin-dependent carboxyltransferase family protein [Christiangramia fulva]AVR47544.1 allophanate hydrolase [Christiangramia fulva]